jgi:hypothetical protein
MAVLAVIIEEVSKALCRKNEDRRRIPAELENVAIGLEERPRLFNCKSAVRALRATTRCAMYI